MRTFPKARQPRQKASAVLPRRSSVLFDSVVQAVRPRGIRPHPPPCGGTFPCQGKAFVPMRHCCFSPKASPLGGKLSPQATDEGKAFGLHRPSLFRQSEALSPTGKRLLFSVYRTGHTPFAQSEAPMSSSVSSCSYLAISAGLKGFIAALRRSYSSLVMAS